MSNFSEEERNLTGEAVCRRPSPKECDILHAATELFSEKGFAGTTTQAIAKKANVSEKTLFKYFPTKQELYDKTLNPALPCFTGEDRGGASGEKRSIRSILQELFLQKLNLSNRDPNILKLTIHEFLANPEFRNTLAEDWAKRYLPVLLPQIELSEYYRKRYGDILEGSLTRAMVGILASYAFDKSYIRPDRKFDDEREIEFMLDLLFNGINGLKTEMGYDYGESEEWSKSE